MLIPISTLCLAALWVPAVSRGVHQPEQDNLCLGVPLSCADCDRGADATAAGMAVSMVITFQIYCIVSSVLPLYKACL